MSPLESMTAAAVIVTFGPFKLNMKEGRLRRGEQDVPLRPKVLALLRYLVAHSGRLVTSEELHDAVWGDTAVTPNAMTNVVGELRRLLDDGRDGRRFIETIPRRGYRFLAEVGDTVPRSLAPHAVTGFVGRSHELARLREAFEAAKAGERRAVFITGEPGGGKTTLVDQFLAGAADAIVARAPCIDANECAETYAPLLRALGELSLGSRRAMVEDAARRHAPGWLAQMPWLVRPSEQASLARSLIGEGGQRLVREADALVAALTRELPLILVLEDLHWSDTATVELLPVLCQSTAPARLLIVGTYRPVDALVHGHPIVPMVAQLRRRESCEVLPLAAFSVAEVGACLGHLLEDVELGTRLADPVGRHCGGNPLFVRAVCDQLRQEGWLRTGAAGWELASDLDRFVPRLPEDLRDLIELQLSGLSPDTLRFLEATSVAGDDATLDLLGAALDFDPDVLGDLGYDVVQRGAYLRLGVGTRSGAAEGDEVFRFTHVLYQRAVYNRIAPSQRRRLHERIGRHLERVYAQRPGEGALRLAMHFEAALDHDRAATYREQAALVAMGRCDYHEALRSLQRAQTHLDLVGETDGIDLRRARVLLTLGNILAGLHGFAHPAVAQAFADAETHAKAAGAVRERVRALLGISSVTLDLGEIDATQPIVDRLLDVIADAPVEAGLHFYSHVRAARLQIGKGEFRVSLESIEKAQGFPVAAGVPIHVDPVAEAHAWRSIALAHLGEHAAAESSVRRAVELASAVDLPWGYAAVIVVSLHTVILQRSRALLDELYHLASAHCRRHDLAYFEIRVEFYRLYREWLAQPSVALAVKMRAVLESLQDRVDAENLLNHRQVIAECLLHGGDAAGATAIVDTSIADCETGGEAHLLVEFWRLRGDILAHASRPRRRPQSTPAEQAYRRACEIAERQGSRLLHLRASTALALERQRRGELGPALADLEASLAAHPPGPAGVDVERARECIASLRAAMRG